MYEVLLHPDAQKAYVNADQALAKKMARCLQQLEQTPVKPSLQVCYSNAIVCPVSADR